MITAQQIKERLVDEKDPIRYIDAEVARCANQMADRCKDVQDTISVYNNRVNENDQFDLQTIKEELKRVGELYMEINSYLKVRKESVKQLKRTEQLNKAMVKRRHCIEKREI